MRYLLLIPSVLAMFLSVMAYVGLLRFEMPRRAQAFVFFIAVSFQFSAIYIASLIDRA